MSLWLFRFFAAAIFFFCFVFSALGNGQSQERQFRIKVPVANIRLEPTTSSPVIGQVKVGTVLEVIEEAGDWVRIYLPTREGDSRRVGYIYKPLGAIEVLKTYSEPEPIISEPEVQAPAKPPVAIKPPIAVEPVPSSNKVEPLLRQTKTAGRFGVGLSMGFAPGGLGGVPTVLYDVNNRNSVVGMFMFVTGASAVSGGWLYRFPPQDLPQSFFFEPFLGGGLSLVSIDFGPFFDRGSYTGFFGTGGAFLRFPKYPHWRVSGALYLTQFNIGEGFSSPALRGIGMAVGFAYFF